MRFQKAQDKLSFTQTTSDSLKADVLAVGKFEQKELDMLKNYMSLSFDYTNTFAGVVVSSTNKDNAWEFIVYNPESSLEKDANCGVAKDKTGNEITIRGLKKLEGQSNRVRAQNFGFEFIQNGKSLGAVSVVNSGQVWLKNDITPEQKLIVSCMATSLLLQ